MSLTLGQKLRQAREEKGITLGEVAEQTRISPLYIESIENDDYRALPGGIFNRGFVKSFAKYVGVDEQEALADYASLLYETEGDVEDVKFHRPEVLTDDRAPSSMLPTLIVAVVILGIMTVGVLFMVQYLKPVETLTNSSTPKTNANPANTGSESETENSPQPVQSPAPDMSTLRFEFKALNQPVSLTVTTDGQTRNQVITPGSTTVFEPKESVKFIYSRSHARFIQLAINGKNITLPPANPRRSMIEFEINQLNVGEILTSGAIPSDGTSTNPVANANAVSPSIETTPPVQIPVASPKPNIAPNTAVRPTTENRITVTPKPLGTIKTPVSTKPSANRPQ